MIDDDGFDAMTAVCIAAYEAVKEHGSRELRTAAELLLLALGREIATRDPTCVSHDRPTE